MLKKFRKFRKAVAVGALALGAVVATAPANKAEARWFGRDVECEGGNAHTVFVIFGVSFQTGGDVPNSALCQ